MNACSIRFASVLLIAILTASAAAQERVDPTARPSPRALFADFAAANQGAWQVDWNPATGTPEAVFGRGLRASEAPVQTLAAARETAARFVDAHRDLLGLCAAQPVESVAQRIGDVWVMVYDLRWRDLPVHGSRVDVRLRSSGHVAMFGAVALPIAGDFDATPRLGAEHARALAHDAVKAALPAPGIASRSGRETLVVWGDVDRATRTPVRLAWEVAVDGGDGFVGRVWIDATNGELLESTSDRHACGCVGGRHRHAASAPGETEHSVERDATAYASVSGTVSGWVNTSTAPDAALTLVGMPRLRIVVVSGSTPGIIYYSGADGSFSVLTDTSDPSPIIEFYLAGNRIADVITDQGTELFHRITVPNNSTGVSVVFGSSSASEIDRAQTNVYWHVDDVSTWAASKLGRARIALIDSCNATVNDPLSCNAFYTANTLRFRSSSATCVNAAYRSVIEHEWGHALDDVYGGISTRDGISEGNADIVAMFRSADPVIAPGFFRDGRSPTYLRTALNTRTYPVAGTVHEMGELWMACAWDVRTRLIARRGATLGVAKAEALVLGSIAGNAKTLRAAVRELFILDDDDPDLCNGTPNYTELSGACTARSIPYPEAPCAPAGAAFPYGPGCPGTGTSGVGLSANADASVVASSTILPASGKIAIQFTTMRPLPVSGVSILAKSLLPGAATAFVSILDHDYGEDAPGAVLAGPIAISVGTADGWYSGAIMPPLPPLPPMSRFYLVVDAPAGTVSRPIAASGASFDAWHSGSSSGWSGPYPAAYAFRLSSPPTPIPALSVANVPELGGTLVMQVHGAPALVPGVFWVGLSDVLWRGLPLPVDLGPFGAPGCPVVASWDLPLVMLTSSVGSMQAALMVPTDPGLVGLSLYLQAAILDVPANAFGVTVSNGVRIVVGG